MEVAVVALVLLERPSGFTVAQRFKPYGDLLRQMVRLLAGLLQRRRFETGSMLIGGAGAGDEPGGAGRYDPDGDQQRGDRRSV